MGSAWTFVLEWLKILRFSAYPQLIDKLRKLVKWSVYSYWQRIFFFFADVPTQMPPLTPGTNKKLTEVLKASFASWEKEVQFRNITKGKFFLLMMNVHRRWWKSVNRMCYNFIEGQELAQLAWFSRIYSDRGGRIEGVQIRLLSSQNLKFNRMLYKIIRARAFER